MAYDHVMQIMFRTKPGVTTEKVAEAFAALDVGAGKRDYVGIAQVGGRHWAGMRTTGQASVDYLSEVQSWVQLHIEPIAEPSYFRLRNKDTDEVIQQQFAVKTLWQRIEDLPATKVVIHTPLLCDRGGKYDCHGSYHMGKDELMDIVGVAQQLINSPVSEATIPWNLTGEGNGYTEKFVMQVFADIESTTVTYCRVISDHPGLLESPPMSLECLVATIEDTFSNCRMEAYAEDPNEIMYPPSEAKRLDSLRRQFHSPREPVADRPKPMEAGDIVHDDERFAAVRPKPGG